MPDLLDQYLAGKKEPDLLDQYLATKPIKEEIPVKEPTWWEAAFAPPKEYKEVYAPELGKMVPGKRVEVPIGTKIIERLKFEWESDWPTWLGLGIYLGTYGLLKYVPVRGETLINRAAKIFAKNNLATLQKRAPDVINTLDDATTYTEMGLKQKLYQATADMKGPDALKTITKITDFVSKYKLPAPETLPMLAQKITGVPSVTLTNKLVQVGLDKIGAEALAGSMNLMKEGINKLVVNQVIDDFVNRSIARTEDLAPLTAEEKLGFTEMREVLDERVTDVLEKEQKIIEPIPKEIAPEVAPKGEIPEVEPEILAEEITPEVEPPTKPPIPPSPLPREMPEEPGRDPLVKLTELIKQAKPIRAEIETEYTKERAKRFAEVDAFIDKNVDEVGGEEGFRTILSKMKGPLIPEEERKKLKISFEPVKDRLNEEELKTLFLRTWKHPHLSTGEKLSAGDGLMDLFMGAIPQPKQLVLLEEIYGSEFIKQVLKKRAWGPKAMETVLEIANVPRVALSTADMSGVLRQNIIFLVAEPVISAKATAKAFQVAFKPKVAEQYFDDLRKAEDYAFMKEMGISITDPTRATLAEREEAFISRFLQRVPIVNIPVGFAERGYTTLLTKVRVDVFRKWMEELKSQDLDPVKDEKIFRAAADVVNTFSGRGSLGKAGNRIRPQLNTIFYSPGLVAARFQALNPVWYMRQPKPVRKKAIAAFAKFVAAGLTTLALIKVYKDATGASDDEISVETNMTSADSGKIKIGNTRYDIWGGHQQFARVFAQVIMGERKSTTTGEIISLNKDEYPFTTRWETVLRFMEGKFAPTPALVKELMQGARTFKGEKMTVGSVAFEKFTPMWIQDVAEVYAEGGFEATMLPGAAAFMGVGVQTYGPRKKKRKKRTIW